MNSKRSIITSVIILSIVAIVGWFLYINEANSPPIVSVDTEKQEQLQAEVDELTAKQQSLEQENIALQHLNKTLKESVDSMPQNTESVTDSASDSQVTDSTEKSPTTTTKQDQLTSELQSLKSKFEYVELTKQQFQEDLKLVEDVINIFVGKSDDSLSISDVKEQISIREENLKSSYDSEPVLEIVEPLMDLIGKQSAQNERTSQTEQILKGELDSLNELIEETLALLQIVIEIPIELGGVSESQEESSADLSSLVSPLVQELQIARSSLAQMASEYQNSEQDQDLETEDNLSKLDHGTVQEVIDSLLNSGTNFAARYDRISKTKSQLKNELNAANELIGNLLNQLHQIAQNSTQTSGTDVSSAESRTEFSSHASSLIEILQSTLTHFEQLVTEHQELKNSLETALESQVTITEDLNLVEEVAHLFIIVSDENLSHSEKQQQIDTKTEEIISKLEGIAFSDVVNTLIESVQHLSNRGEQVGATKDQLAAAMQRSDQLTTQLESANERLRTIRDDFRNSMNQAELRSDEISRLELQLKSEIDAANELIQIMLNQLQNVAETSKETESTEETATKITSQLSLLTENLQSSEAHIDQLINEHQKTKQQLELMLQGQLNIDDNIVLVEEIKHLFAVLSDSEAREELESKRNEVIANLDRRAIPHVVAALKTAIEILADRLEEAELTKDQLAIAQRRTQYLYTRLKNASEHLRRLRKQIRNFEKVADLKSEEVAAARIQLAKEMQRSNVLLNELQVSASETDRLQASIESIEQVAKSKQTELENLQSELTVISLETDVLFDSGSAQLRPEVEIDLLRLADLIKNIRQNRILSIEGHTDNKALKYNLTRTFQTNWELSAYRAASAAKFLIENGVSKENIRIVGYGEQKPIASNDTPEGRAANRRLEIRIVPQLAESAIY